LAEPDTEFESNRGGLTVVDSHAVPRLAYKAPCRDSNNVGSNRYVRERETAPDAGYGRRYPALRRNQKDIGRIEPVSSIIEDGPCDRAHAI
jgi:hypothetical protein